MRVNRKQAHRGLSPTKVLHSQHQCFQLIDSIGFFISFSPIHHRCNAEPVHAVGGLFSSEIVAWRGCQVHVELPDLGVYWICRCSMRCYQNGE